MMHGFLNIFLAAAFLRVGMDPPLVVELVNEQSPDTFQFDSGGVSWRSHRLSVYQIAEARRDFAISFGSCSFIEPIDDLRSLHLL
jgi:5-carboxymethyl-2-hydroxymuconate isomerase